jgi:hypothetical protein
MKRITSLALFALAGVLSTGSALAQDASLRATMPFDFIVGNKQLPSGTYTVSPVFSSAVAIRSWDNNTSALSTVSPASNQSNGGGKLVFDKVGDQYFLREVFGGSAGVNVLLPVSRSEEKARHQETMARNLSQVSIAAEGY